MKTYPLVSVIIPAYNHASYIDAAVQSVIEQDYPQIEIMVIDDGSTDGTAQAAEKALERGGRPYRMIRQENAGAHATINRGIQQAKGDYIAILNSDDRYLPGRLRIMVNALTTSGRRFAISKLAHIDSIGFPHPYQDKYLQQVDESKRFPTPVFELLRHNIAATTSNFVFHRSLFAEVGGFAPYVTSHDWDYLLRALLVEEPLFVDEILLEYRIHAQGTLQANLTIVEKEIEQIMLNYLSTVDTAKNAAAPGPAQWPAYWHHFSDTYLERIRSLPLVKDQLERMRVSDGNKTYVEPPAPPSDTSSGIDQERPHIDLDLTQINLDIPPARKDAKTQSRLLLILPWMVLGGAERFALNLIDQLKARGWQITIACTSPSHNDWKDEFSARTGDIFVLPDQMPIKDYPRYLAYLIALRDFDAVILQGSIEGYRLLPTLRALYPQLPILDYLHFVTENWMAGGFPRLSVLYRDSLDGSITSCQQVKDWMVNAGMDEKRISVCPIGVDAQHWRPDEAARKRIRQQLQIGDDEVVLIYAARLEAQKQPLVFAETLRHLSEDGFQFRALIAGDGSLRNELESKLSLHGLNDKTSLLGAVKSDDMPALLAAGDIFFLPSQNEGISSAVYEAMAAQLAVVGADVGGQAELVTPECGILIPFTTEADQPAVYAQVLKELIEDTPRRKKLGTAARERITGGFTLGHMGTVIGHILSETIRLKREGRLAPSVLTPQERINRDAQHVVEYLQARQEWRSINERHLDLMHQHEDLSRKYFDLLQPKPPSHWFYLWLRQLFLPASHALKRSRIISAVIALQRWLKRTWIKE